MVTLTSSTLILITTPTTNADKLSSPLVQYIKKKNPHLGISRIVRLIELQEKYASELLDSNEVSLAKPIWDTSLLSAFAWSRSYAPDSLWGALEHGRQTIHSVRSILGHGVI